MKQKNELIDAGKLMFGKIPPNSKDIEVAILGIMLIIPNSIKVVKEILEPNDFYVSSNQLVCNAIFEISKTSNPDYLLVAQFLIDNGTIEEVGGVYHLTQLTNRVTSDTNIKQYCLTVKQMSVQRRLIDFAAMF